MHPQLRTLRQVYEAHLQSFYHDCDADMLHTIQQTITPLAEQIAATFYEAMLNDPDGKHYLNHELVHDRLHASMTQWIIDAFKPRKDHEIPAFIDKQLRAGHVHARMNLPPHLLDHGMRMLKQSIGEHLVAANVTPITLALHKMHRLMDITAALLTECYFTDLIENERQSQMLRQQLLGHDLALRCERLRADMFDWVRRLLAALHHKDQIPLEQLPSARHSDFGLWITHKASLYFPDMHDVSELGDQLDRLEALTEEARQARGDNQVEALSAVVSRIDKTITRISWLFSSLADHYAGLDGGRDTLTKLYNRRFLDPVLQRETQYCIRNGSHFAIVMIDLDHFKEVNDHHGHEAGDKVLVQSAEVMQSNIRAGDFLFRHGGEEFMIVMTDITQTAVEKVAQKLVDAFASHQFHIGDGKTIRVTASIGASIYRGHPDYARVISEADDALYQAKQTGRNRYALAA